MVEVIGEEEMAGKFKIHLNSYRTNRPATLASKGCTQVCRYLSSGQLKSISCSLSPEVGALGVLGLSAVGERALLGVLLLPGPTTVFVLGEACLTRVCLRGSALTAVASPPSTLSHSQYQWQVSRWWWCSVWWPGWPSSHWAALLLSRLLHFPLLGVQSSCGRWQSGFWWKRLLL